MKLKLGKAMGLIAAALLPLAGFAVARPVAECEAMMKVAVSSAIVRDGRLAIETVDGSKYEYDVETGKLLSENAPVADKTEVILALPTEPRDLAAA